MRQLLHETRGPFRADQIRDGDYYELSNGHAIKCAPGGRDHAETNVSGAEVLDSDPDVEWSGIDAGYTPEPGTLRAPDVAVGKPGGEGPGWIPGTPPLAVEYAGIGQDDEELAEKIADLLIAGTRFVWVVRLVGPRRVEVYEPGKPAKYVGFGQELTAPGVLRNPVPVEALYDRTAAHKITLRNLLQRQGYEDLDAVLAQGHTKGLKEGRDQGKALAIVTVLRARGVDVDDDMQARIVSLRDSTLLDRLLVRAATVSSAAELFAEEKPAS